jgi:thioredoxin 1
MSNTVTITDSTFDEQVRDSQRPTLVDFWATWCPPCRAMEPVLERLAASYAGQVTVGKMDVDANPRTAAEYRVQSIPTLILFDRGQPLQRLVGVQHREILEGILDGMLASAAAKDR